MSKILKDQVQLQIQKRQLGFIACGGSAGWKITERKHIGRFLPKADQGLIHQKWGMRNLTRGISRVEGFLLK